MLTRLQVMVGRSTTVNFEAFTFNYSEDDQVGIVYIFGKRHLTVRRCNTEYSNIRRLSEKAIQIGKEQGDKVSIVSTELPLDSIFARELLGERYDEFMLEIRGENK